MQIHVLAVLMLVLMFVQVVEFVLHLVLAPVLTDVEVAVSSVQVVQQNVQDVALHAHLIVVLHADRGVEIYVQAVAPITVKEDVLLLVLEVEDQI